MVKKLIFVLFFLHDRSVINISFPQTRGVELCLKYFLSNFSMKMLATMGLSGLPWLTLHLLIVLPLEYKVDIL